MIVETASSSPTRFAPAALQRNGSPVPDRVGRRPAALLAPLLFAAVLATATCETRAQGYTLDAAAPELTETGTPPFVLLRPESMGLSAPATDLHELPNGAILAVSGAELAIGDGVRWETFRRHPDAEQVDLNNVAVDRAGTIFAGVSGGSARIDLGEDGQWRLTRVATFPADPVVAKQTLTRVVAIGDEWYWHNGSGPLVAWHPGQP